MILKWGWQLKGGRGKEYASQGAQWKILDDFFFQTTRAPIPTLLSSDLLVINISDISDNMLPMLPVLRPNWFKITGLDDL